MVFVVNSELGMGVGKIAAQVLTTGNYHYKNMPIIYTLLTGCPCISRLVQGAHGKKQ